MLIRLLDVLSELFMLVFIIWTLAETSKRIVLLFVFAFCAYVIWAFFDFHRSWGVLVQ